MPFRRSVMGCMAAVLLLGAVPAGAQMPSLIPRNNILNAACDFGTGRFSADCVPLYIAYLIAILFGTTGAIFLIMLTWGGYEYLLGVAKMGDKESGKARIRFAIMGFLVSALAFYIVDFVLNSVTSGP